MLGQWLNQQNTQFDIVYSNMDKMFIIITFIWVVVENVDLRATWAEKSCHRIKAKQQQPGRIWILSLMKNSYKYAFVLQVINNTADTTNIVNM